MGFLATLRRIVDRLPLACRRSASLGARGEAVAQRYLKKRGYRIVARGQRNQLGELDLVAVDRRTVVFVEVKTRRSVDAGHPAEAVDSRKQQRLARLALAYLKRHDLLEVASRFDVVAILWPSESRPPQVQHIKDAFRPVCEQQMF